MYVMVLESKEIRAAHVCDGTRVQRNKSAFFSLRHYPYNEFKTYKLININSSFRDS